jgi:manganese-dependent inorganic pyrophosphatase
MLSDSIFCGHLVTDLDSIAGAIGAAELYGGIPARASQVNSETQFALDYWGVEKPEPIEELVVSLPGAGICLVDHQQMSQVNPSIDPERIVGVIDHHALQNSTIVTDRAIYIDIRPWGSMSTIIAHTFLSIQRRPRKSTAGMLLCAILSDTLNLMGPTTTDWDRMMVAILCEVAGVRNIENLAKAQFKAKSKELESELLPFFFSLLIASMSGLTAQQLCDGDMKVFTVKSENYSGNYGFAVVETTDDGVILARKDELLETLRISRQEKSLDMMFLAVVNIVELKSTLLVIDTKELSLAKFAFPATAKDAFEDDEAILKHGLYSLGGLVSRKKDFVPAISKAITKQGWVPPSTSD